MQTRSLGKYHVCVQSVVVCGKDFPEDLAYKIVKTVFEHKDELNQIHVAFKETTLDKAQTTVVSPHPGAIRYFKEMNVSK